MWLHIFKHGTQVTSIEQKALPSVVNVRSLPYIRN
jgi:hypothetical protein